MKGILICKIKHSNTNHQQGKESYLWLLKTSVPAFLLTHICRLVRRIKCWLYKQKLTQYEKIGDYCFFAWCFSST